MSAIQNEEILVKVGPRGDLSSRNPEWDESYYGNIKQILVTHGRAINSIQMMYDHNGTAALAHRHGGDGDNFDCVALEAWEYLTCISGHYGPIEHKSAMVVRSLTFSTNKTTYGPYGGEDGNPFSFNMQSGAVTFGGFHGRSNGSYLCAVGIHVKVMAKHHFKPDPHRHHLAPKLCSASDESQQQTTLLKA